MSILREGNIVDMAFILILFALMYVTMKRAATKLPKLREFAAVGAIDEAVGRAAEMGRPVLYTVAAGSRASLQAGVEAPQVIAGLSILSHVARRVANYGARFLVACGQSEVLLPTRDIVRSAYLMEGKPEAYSDDLVEYYGEAFNAAVISYIQREKVAATFIIGAIWTESMHVLFTGHEAGAMQIAGTANTHQMQFMACLADYFLIGEDIFAFGAYITKDANMLGMLVGEDYGKLILLGLLLITFISAIVGSTAILDFISL